MDGVRRRIVVVGCGQSKLDISAPARELYTGSLFASQRRYAEASGAAWGILSAKHGFLLPNEFVAPYDVQLGASRDVRRAWAHRAAVAFCAAFPWISELMLKYGPFKPLPLDVECLAGETYAECFVGAVKTITGIEVSCPLRGRQLGARRHWLSLQCKQIAKREATP